MAIPVDYKPDQIPVHVVLAESEPAAVSAILKDQAKALSVDDVTVEPKVAEVTEAPKTVETPVEEAPKLVEAVLKPAVVEVPKITISLEEEKPVEAREEAVESPKMVDVIPEEKKTEDAPVMLLVEVSAEPEATTEPAAKSSEEDSDDMETVAAVVPEDKNDKKAETPAKTEEKNEEKDLETQSSVWGGWSAPAVAVAAPVWPVASAGYHHSAWAPTYSSYPSYYPTYKYSTAHYPTSHYSSHGYWPATAAVAYPAAHQAWW